jgi:hypothetical protein
MLELASTEQNRLKRQFCNHRYWSLLHSFPSKYGVTWLEGNCIYQRSSFSPHSTPRHAILMGPNIDFWVFPGLSPSGPAPTSEGVAVTWSLLNDNLVSQPVLLAFKIRVYQASERIIFFSCIILCIINLFFPLVGYGCSKWAIWHSGWLGLYSSVLGL